MRSKEVVRTMLEIDCPVADRPICTVCHLQADAMQMIKGREIPYCRNHIHRPYDIGTVKWFVSYTNKNMNKKKKATDIPVNKRNYLESIGPSPVCSQVGCMKTAIVRQKMSVGLLPRCEDHISYPCDADDLKWYKKSEVKKKIEQSVLLSLSNKEKKVYELVKDKKVVLIAKSIAGPVGRLVQKGLAVIVKDPRIPRKRQKVVILKTYYTELNSNT